MIVEPVNDVPCLSKLAEAARRHSTTPRARYLATLYGTLAAVAAAIRAKPDRDDTGRAGGEMVTCDVLQHVDFWTAAPNCFERTADYLALAELLEPSTRFSLETLDMTAGRHTLPLVDVGGKWEPIDLWPAARRQLQAQDPRTTEYQARHTAVEWSDTAGGAVLRFYGLGSVADWAHRQWQGAGYMIDRPHALDWQQHGMPAPAPGAGVTQGAGTGTITKPPPAMVRNAGDTSTAVQVLSIADSFGQVALDAEGYGEAGQAIHQGWVGLGALPARSTSEQRRARPPAATRARKTSNQRRRLASLSLGGNR